MAITTATSPGTFPRLAAVAPAPRAVSRLPAPRSAGGFDGGGGEGVEQCRHPGRWQPRVQWQNRRAAAIQRRCQRIQQSARFGGREQERMQGPVGHRRKVNGRNRTDQEALT